MKKWLYYLSLFVFVITLSVGFSLDVNASTNVSYSINTYYVRTMTTNDSTQVGNYSYTSNPFYTNNISGTSRWLPRQIGFDGNASSKFNSSYLYTLSYRFNYPSSTDFFDWQKYMNYARFVVYGSTSDLFSCSIISNTSSYTDVKCTFKRSTTDNYFFFYFDFYNSSAALRQIGIPDGFGPQLSFSNISLTYTQDTGDIQVEQNNIIINQNNQTNQKLDEAQETRKGIWETIKELPSKFLDMLKSLFIPEEEMQELIDDFKNTMSTKLGALYQVGDLIVSVFDSILDPPDKNSCITFPEIKDPMFNKLLINETDYCFDTLRKDFDFLFTLSDMIISIVCTLAFANMLYRKFEAFIGGVNSDY